MPLAQDSDQSKFERYPIHTQKANPSGPLKKASSFVSLTISAFDCPSDLV